MKFLKLNQKGILHWSMILPVIAVLAVAGVGIKVLGASHADSYVSISGMFGYNCHSLPTLGEGNDSDCVKILQRGLNNIDAYHHLGTPTLTVDGNFGPKTKAAVETFQRYKKLTVDGVVGVHTWTAFVDDCSVWGTRCAK